MSAVQQVLMMSGFLVTLPDDDSFLSGVVAAEAFDQAEATAFVTLDTDGSLVLTFTAEPPVGATIPDPSEKTYTWFPAPTGGNAGIFSARMRVTSGSFSSPTPIQATSWRAVSTNLQWGINQTVSLGGGPSSLSKSVQAVLEISYTSDPANRVIANTNVNLTASATIVV
jgi:hypothetical protein